MNAILSIKPEFVEEIKAGKKRYEYRKSVFKKPVEKVYVYASAPVSKVIGEFQPEDVLSGAPMEIWKKTKRFSGISEKFYKEYYRGKAAAYAIVIQNFKLYKEPKDLPFQAPQSFRYIENL